MRKSNRNLILGLVCLIVPSIWLAAESAGQVATPTWKARMRSMLGDVAVLFPLVFEDAKFNDPANQKNIRAAVDSLAKHSAELKSHASHFDREKGLKIDPSFPFIAESFENEIKLTQLSLGLEERGRLQAKNYLRAALSKCVMCHSQSANGPELKMSQFHAIFAGLSRSDRFMALAVTRQFDEALDEYSAIAKDAKVTKPDGDAFDRNTRGAVTMAVRVKRDPGVLLKIIDAAMSSGAGTAMLAADLKTWKKSALQWQGEREAERKTDEALLQNASRLIELGRTEVSKLDANSSADILLLRASADLHDLLSNYPSSKLRAESYLQLATVYESLPGFSIWDLADEYLGACVEENPHSAVGEKCYQRYAENITLGYTGSAGTHVPKAVQDNLTRLKKRATVLPAKGETQRADEGVSK